MKKKIILLLFISLLITGCNSKQGNIESKSINEKKYSTDGFSYITCTRNTETEDDSKVEINYEIFYNKDNYIEILKSYEKVTSSDSNILKQYKDAYETIYEVYDNLDYYDHEVKSTNNSVTSITYINYGKIDMDKLMDIEGYEDNVKVTNGKIKLNDWISFAKKYGTECSIKS